MRFRGSAGGVEGTAGTEAKAFCVKGGCSTMGGLGRSPVDCTAAPVVGVDSIAREIG